MTHSLYNKQKPSNWQDNSNNKDILRASQKLSDKLGKIFITHISGNIIYNFHRMGL